MNWPRQLQEMLFEHNCVVVTLNLISGSAPRESGSRMIVTKEQVSGSVGGGNLEYRAIERARQLLEESLSARHEHQLWGLGPALNQCCGGAVMLHFEVLEPTGADWLSALTEADKESVQTVLLTAVNSPEPMHHVFQGSSVSPGFLAPLAGVSSGVAAALSQAVDELLQTRYSAIDSSSALVEIELDGTIWWLELMNPKPVPVYLFGAGHVGKEVAALLSRFPFLIHWVDQRADMFPALSTQDQNAENLRVVCFEQPAMLVADAPPGSVFIVMTHSHQLDEDICYEILQRNDFSWLGLIGSLTKRRRFVHRLEDRGIPSERLTRLICPVGLRGQISTNVDSEPAEKASRSNSSSGSNPRSQRTGGIRGKQPATIALSLVAQLMMEQPWIVENS